MSIKRVRRSVTFRKLAIRGKSFFRRFANLTERERDVMQLVAEGYDNREIAAKLFLSEGTVRNRISDILAKTNVTNRTKLAVEWLACQ